MEQSPVRMEGSRLTLHVWVVPGAARPGIAGIHGDKLKVRVASPPEAGRANAELTDLLETELGFGLDLIRGMSGRHKVFELPVSEFGSVERKLGLAG